MIVSSVGLTGYNLYEDRSAEIVSNNTVNKLLEHIDTLNSNANDRNDTSATNKENDSNDESDAPISKPTIPDYLLNPEIEMPTVFIDGEHYIGVLEIPELGLTLPINSEWSYKRLKNTPCRYTGSAYKNNLVIAAHNYNSHFGKLNQLTQGDLVYFTDTDGNKFKYTVDVTETLIPEAVEEMTSGEWALSLFTCTPGGANRVTLRCDLIED
jgi:sortase A